MLFPLAFLFNNFSMTAIIILLGLAGKSLVVSDLGVLQALTLTVFYSFSANSRILIASSSSAVTFNHILKIRYILLAPLIIISILLGSITTSSSLLIILIITLRRSSEWISEVYLSEYERLNLHSAAFFACLFEFSSILFFILSSLFLSNSLLASLTPWGLSPLFILFFRKELVFQKTQLEFKEFLPHIGSSAIINCSVYVFRAIIIILVGSDTAGKLFLGFAIGGILPTIFGQILGPTLLSKNYFIKLREHIQFLSLIVTLVGVSVFGIEIIFIIKNPNFYWDFFATCSVAFSLSGGIIMTASVFIKQELIQRNEKVLVFASDVLSNSILVILTPIIYFFGGVKFLSGLYFVSSLLNFLLVYRSYLKSTYDYTTNKIIFYFILCLLIIPIFIQIDGGVFNSLNYVYESNGDLLLLPLPISLLGVFAGIFIFYDIKNCQNSIIIIFSMIVIFFISVLFFKSQGIILEKTKLLSFIQIIIPFFGLVLGEMIGAFNDQIAFEKTFIIVIFPIIVLQLLRTWAIGLTVLNPNIYFFSVYQHLQYFPMIVCAGAMMATYVLWERGIKLRVLTGFFDIICGIFIAASMSLSAITIWIIFILSFLFTKGSGDGEKKIKIFVVGTSILLCLTYLIIQSSGYLSSYFHPGSTKIGEMTFYSKIQDKELNRNLLSDSVPEITKNNNENLCKSDRIELWKYYLQGVFDSPGHFMFGHSSPPNRICYPSAHNYLLDVAYNFGIIAILPLSWLFYSTIRQIWIFRFIVINNNLLIGAFLSFIYLVVVENTLKVGLRQPYSGIITLVIWGILNSRLRKYTNSYANISESTE